MDLEEQILRYYLKVFSILLLIISTFIFFSFYYIVTKNLSLKNEIISITKGQNIEDILNKNINFDNTFEIKVLKLFNKIYFINNSKFFHYGNFNFQKNLSYLDFLHIISKPSNVLNKITIVEGWSKKELNKELSKYFQNFNTIGYNDILADTYLFDKNKGFEDFYNYLKKFKKNYLAKLNKSKLLKNIDNDQIIVIGSMIEKEGLDYEDKKKISSVIFNRLKKNMKLQIDATVLFALTNGEYDLDRNLTLRDLKINHPYNTYFIRGLPPKPIAYVGTKTIDIINETYYNEDLFYFYNSFIGRHIFSKNYNEHKKKLYEYRNKK